MDSSRLIAIVIVALLLSSAAEVIINLTLSWWGHMAPHFPTMVAAVVFTAVGMGRIIAAVLRWGW